MPVLSPINLQSNKPGVLDDISRVLEIFFIVAFGLLFLLNLSVGIKYKIYENSSSLFITISLMLLDIFRLGTFILTFFYTDFFFSSELLIRLGHDIPSFTFDCVTIALLFQFIQTYDVLSNHERAFANLSKQLYLKIEYTIVAVYVAFIVFDIISLSIDASQHFQGTNILSSISECLLCVMVTIIWLMYIVLFFKFLQLFNRTEALKRIKWQVVTFFVIIITLLCFRLLLHWFFFANDYNSEIAILYENQDSVKLFWIHIGQLAITLVEVLFNIIVLYNLIDNEKNTQRVIERSFA